MVDNLIYSKFFSCIPDTKNPSLVFNGDRKIQTRVSTVPAFLVFHWNGGPEIWEFPVDTEHQWLIPFLTHNHRIVLRTFPLCLNMEVSERIKISKDKQFWYRNSCFVQTKKTHTNTLLFYSQKKEPLTLEIVNRCCTSQRRKGRNRLYPIIWNAMKSNVTCSLSRIQPHSKSYIPT